MRISLLLITVALLALLGPGCALPEAARTAPPTAQQTPPAPSTPAPTAMPPTAMPPSSAPPLSRPAPIAISTPTVRRTPSAPPTWQTTDRGSRTLRIEPIGAVAVETVPPPPPAPAPPPPVPPAPADDLGAPPTGPLPLPMVR